MVLCTGTAGVRRDHTETLMDLIMYLAANFGLDSFNDHSGPPEQVFVAGLAQAPQEMMGSDQASRKSG